MTNKAPDDYIDALDYGRRKREENLEEWQSFAILLMLPVGVWLWSWAKATLWGWFLVPLGVPSITTAHAFGLSVLLGAFTYRRNPLEWEDAGFETYLAMLFTLPLMSLAFGRLALWWMG